MTDPRAHAQDEVEAILARARLECYRDNVLGARDLLREFARRRADPRVRETLDRLEKMLWHLESREAYLRAQEAQYKSLRGKAGLKHLEKWVRILLGKKTRKMIRRRARNPEFELLEGEILAHECTSILDAGSGEGGVCLALAARHPHLRIVGVEASETNVRLARRLNRFPNVAFRQGLAEEVHLLFDPESFDLVYSFAVLEHVRDVDETVASILKVLRPGGRFCFVVPMRRIEARGPIPEFVPHHGYADHVRVFSEQELRDRFGHHPGFMVHKIPGAWKPGEMPSVFVPVEFGSFFVSFVKAG